MKRTSSRRFTRWPMPWSLMISSSHLARGGEHRLDDVVIAGAAAEVAREPLAHRGLVEASVGALHEVDGADDHAWRAEAALQGVMRLEGRLHRMQVPRRAQALDGGDAGVLRLAGEHRARLHGPPIH